MTTVWIDGAMVETAEARVDALDMGVLTGYGVFESMKVVRGAAFARTRHLARLTHSARVVGLRAPDSEVVLRALDQVLAGAPDATRVRVTVLAGRVGAPPSVIVHAERQPPWPPVARAVTSPFARNERSATVGAKTTSYAENVIARQEALIRGADEALLCDSRGYLSEGTASNLFLEVDGRLCTPSTANGCLQGVTRDLIGELVDVSVCDDLDLDALARTSEAFLTSTTRGVHPLASIDGVALPTAPGPLTRAAGFALAELEQRTEDP